MVNYSGYKRPYFVPTKYITNYGIKAREVRLIDDEGKNLGVMQTSEALKLAKEKELDLLLISPNIEPPVAKIVNYNKFLYEERKKESIAKARSKKSEMKELRFTPVTGEGDILRFVKRAKEFLDNGDKVKVSCVMKGRQQAFPDVAFNKIKEVADALVNDAKVETEPKRVGNTIWMVFAKK